jgi:uncharacterized coiled-coil protein SlyX
MLLDVAYILRELLNDLHASPDCIHAVLLHATGQKPTARELARINSYAALMELNHFSQQTTHYPGEPLAGISPQGGSEAPFQECYLVDLGEGLAQADADRATRSVAEYLRLNILPPLAAPISAFRTQTHAALVQGGVESSLRTMGVCRITFPRAPLAKLLANLFCQDIVQRWRSKDKRRALQTGVQALWKVEAWGVDPAVLTRHFCDAAEGTLGEPPAEHFAKMIAASPLGQPTPPKQPELGKVVRGLVAAVDNVIGDDVSDGKTVSLCQTLMRAQAQKVAGELGKGMFDWLVGLVENDAHRVQAAELGSQALAADLIITAAKGQEQKQRAIQLRDNLRARLLAADHAERAGGVQRWIATALGRDKSEGLTAMFLEYAQLKLTVIASERTLEVIGELSRRVAEFRDNLVLCQQRLRHLFDYFDTQHETLQPEAKAETNVPGVLELLPGQSIDRQRSAHGLLAAIPTERIEEFKERFQQEVLGVCGGLFGLATDNGPRFEAIKDALESRALDLAAEQIAHVDAAHLFLEKYSGPGAGKDALAQLWRAAAPRLEIQNAWRQVLIAVPDSYHGDMIRDMVTSLFPDTPIHVAHTSGDVVLCMEVANLSWANVAMELSGDRVSPPEILKRLMTRTDVNWTPLLMRADTQHAEPVPAAAPGE